MMPNKYYFYVFFNILLLLISVFILSVTYVELVANTAARHLESNIYHIVIPAGDPRTINTSFEIHT